MKLTKGKISKLYSKNKQSLRRKKNGKGKTSRNRTFRKRKGLNLANKSLKSFYNRRGGAPDGAQEQAEIKEKESPTAAEPIVPTAAVETTAATEPNAAAVETAAESVAAAAHSAQRWHPGKPGCPSQLRLPAGNSGG